MTKEHDTQPDPIPREDDSEKEAALQAEADAIERELAMRRPPVYYEERAQSDGERGARYYTAHEPAKAIHNTIPDGRVILNTTPAPDPEFDEAGRTTLRMARGPSGTDPMGQAPLLVTPPAVSPAGPIRKINRANEVTMDVALPISPPLRSKMLFVAVGSAAAFAVLVLVGLTATSREDKSTSGSSAKPSATMTASSVVVASSLPAIPTAASTATPSAMPSALSPPVAETASAAPPVPIRKSSAVASAPTMSAPPRAASAKPSNTTAPPSIGKRGGYLSTEE